MPSEVKDCTNCIWWTEILVDSLVQEKKGFCHRYPPNQIKDYQPNLDKREYPIVSVGWCGEHQKKTI